jgi:hypothetical protein
MTTPITDSDKQQQSSTLLNTFHKDGYILLPSPLLSPSFISQLHTECLDIFHTVLDWLCVVDAADFAESWRICEGRVVPFPQRQHRSSAAEYDDDDNLNDSDDGGSQANSSDSRKKEYKYPIKVGLKNGYQELVMRSPGRYELALLMEHRDYSYYNDDSCGGCGDDGGQKVDNCSNGTATNNRKAEASEKMNHSAAETEAADCCDDYYNGKRLMTVEMIEQVKRRFILANANKGVGDGGSDEKNRSVNDTASIDAQAVASSPSRRSYLQQLLGWIKQYEKKNINDGTKDKHDDIQHDSSSNDCNEMHHHSTTQDDEQPEAEEKNVDDDEMSIKSFMELVSAIFPPSSTTSSSIHTDDITTNKQQHA